MLIPLVLAGILAAWAFLTLVGSERTRRVGAQDAAVAAAVEAANTAIVARSAPFRAVNTSAVAPPKSSAPAPPKPVDKPAKAATAPPEKAPAGDAKAKPAKKK